jgi:hypothetical protein
MSKKSTVTPDAPESNAGDDFHVLWAVRHSLLMLCPGSDLKAIRPEGAAVEESDKLDPQGDKLLGIDLAEYYGGRDFTSSDKVIHSQLKYSTRRSHEKWSVAKLTSGKKSGCCSGSIIHRLFNIFKAYLSAASRDIVLKKLSIRLVSNKGCNTDILAALFEGNKFLLGRPGEVSAATLLKNVNIKNKNILDKIRLACLKSSSCEFTDFLRVIDFSMCGEGSRLEQDFEIAKSMKDLGYYDFLDQYAKLKDFINRRMMPEARRMGVICEEDIFAALGISGRDYIYPSPSKIEIYNNCIDRKCYKITASEIVNESKKIVCIHGGAGIGKSTFISNLKKHLPEGSVVIKYDCYGSGSYLDSSEVRHGYTRALVQITNELASVCGLHLLLDVKKSEEDMLRELKKRIVLAEKILRKASPDALIVVAVDAADNSIAASKEYQDASFINGIVNLEFPIYSRLVLTCRTHRIPDMKLPKDSKLVEIEAFCQEESKRHVEKTSVSFSIDDLRIFHQITNGIPRLQSYILDNIDTDLKTCISRFGSEKTSLEKVIDERLLEAGLRNGDRKLADKICPVLLSLPRPIPVEFAVNVSGLSENAVSDFCTDMIGLKLINNSISFLDEDFETHLKSKFVITKNIKNKVADILYEYRNNDKYAATHLARVLSNAGMQERLVRLVHEEGAPGIIDDVVSRQNVYISRITYAIRGEDVKNNYSDLIKLLIVAGKSKKTDKALKEMLKDNADLTSLYKDPEIIENLCFETKDEVGWFGSEHFQCSVAYSRTHAYDKASKHLNMAMACIKRWSLLSDDDRGHIQVTVDDVALGVEACLRLNCYSEAKKWLGRWRPRTFVRKVLEKVCDSVFKLDGISALDFLIGTKPSVSELMIYTKYALKNNVLPPQNWLDRIYNRYKKFSDRRTDADKELSGLLVYAADAASLLAMSADVISFFLDECKQEPLNHIPSVWQDSDLEKLDLLLKFTSLRTVLDEADLKYTDESLLPERLLSQTEEREKFKAKEEIRTFHEVYKILWNVYISRAKILLRLPVDDVSQLFGSKINSSHLEYRRNHKIIKLKATLIVEIMVWKRDGIDTFQKLIDNYCTDDLTDLSLSIAESGVVLDSFHGLLVNLLGRVADYIQNSIMTARDKIDYLLRCCRISGNIDQKIGAHYFQLAVESASGIDDEDFWLVRLLSQFALQRNNKHEAIEDSVTAGKLAELIEDCRQHLGKWSELDWDTCIQGISALSPSLALSVICRWDQQQIFHSNDMIFAFLKNFQGGCLASEDCFAMSYLLNDNEAIENSIHTINRLISSNSDKQKIGQMIDLVLDRSMRLARNTNRYELTQKVLQLIDKNKIGENRAVKEARRFYDFYKGLNGENSSEFNPVYKAPGLSDGHIETQCIGLLTDGISIFEPSEIIEAFIKLAKIHEDKNVSWKSQNDNKKELENKIASSVLPKNYCAYIENLISLTPEVFSFDDLVSILQKRFELWYGHPDVRKLKDIIFDKILENLTDELFFGDYFRSHKLKSLVDSLGLDNNAVCATLLTKSVNNIVHLNPQSTYDICHYYSRTLTSDNIELILNWFFSNKVLEIKSRNLACSGLCENSQNGESLLYFLLYYIGHPDKRRRWLSLYAIRADVMLGNRTIVQKLLSLCSSIVVHPFMMPNSVFYKFSAKHYLLILIEYISYACPDIIVSMSNDLAKEALNVDEPHAIILQLSKRICIKLAKYRPDVFSADELQRIDKVLSPGCISLDDSNRKKYMRSNYRTSKGEAFHFDSTDTLPYWYDPAGNVFGISGSEFCKEAERWICDKWGVTFDTRSNDPVRKWLIDDRNWQYSSNGHGSLPMIEDLHTYYEFNSMFCVMGEYARRFSTIEDEFYGNKWDHWIKQWDVCNPSLFPSDSRQATPLDAKYWSDKEFSDEKWIYNINKENFYASLGLAESIYPGFVVLNGHTSRRSYHFSESVKITSALVSSETSDFLVNALISAHPYDYRLPLEDDDAQIDFDLGDSIRFVLQGYLIHEFKETQDKFGQYDQFRNGYQEQFIRPGEVLGKWLEDKHGIIIKYGIVPCVNEKIQIFQDSWNDNPFEDRDIGFYSSGVRLWLSYEKLIDFLKYTKSDMIFECSIDRRGKDYEAKSETERECRKRMLYILRSTGQEKFCIAAWPEDNE